MTNSQPQLFEVAPFRISELANPDLCITCHSAIWTLLSREGFKIHLDVTPITPKQDLEFYVAKVMTFRVWRSGESFEVDWRGRLKIMADDGTRPVLVRHICPSELSDLSKRVTEHPNYWARKAKGSEL